MTEENVSVEDLVDVLNQTAGTALTADKLAQSLHESFSVLGVDSLGLLGVIAELERRYRISLPEGMEDSPTPADLMDSVNGFLKEGV